MIVWIELSFYCLFNRSTIDKHEGLMALDLFDFFLSISLAIVFIVKFRDSLLLVSILDFVVVNS